MQGRDKDCILVSFVKSTCKGSSHSTLLADWHRINVAITRAKVCAKSKNVQHHLKD